MTLQSAEEIDKAEHMANELLNKQDQLVTDLCNKILMLIKVNQELRLDLMEKNRIIRVLNASN